MNSPVTILKQGHFWTGIQRHNTPLGTIAYGAMSVQYQIPQELKFPYPIVFIHGGGGQGCEFLSTPDGRPGWAQYFLRQGFSTYIIDRAGHGRSPFSEALGEPVSLLTYELVQDLFTQPKSHIGGEWAKLAKNWPDNKEAIDQFMAGAGPVIGALAETEKFARLGGAELLDQIGPCILVTHSMGGPCGWVIADERPDLVKAIISIEPLGPPFSEPFPGLGALEWGITASPLQFTTSAPSADQILDSFQTINALAEIPIAILTGEASFMNAADPLTVEFLKQHGALVEHVKLAEHGMYGNGHFMIGETNSDEIAQFVIDLIKSKLPNESEN
ncbi:alpha/beta hydrolase [Acinetobacter populi]|uniref:AB hydrolase-1 domain-containing protein n=1 Tax=Acinetobacter populi TaxID=1582270 RepID=A0A1Z9YVG8_9GAMM|nr:alpha/beta hydrolase [Acinetobacter populi]OUY06246.1 hypothetical protein CAP51_13310 [Acinetobacter populi]